MTFMGTPMANRSEPAERRSSCVVQAPSPTLAQRGAEGLGDVGHGAGLVAAAAVNVGAAIAVVGGQDLLQQPPARRVQGFAHRHLHRPQHVLAGDRTGQGHRGRPGEGGYLGGDLRLEVREEPPFSAPVSASGRSLTTGRTGRASQIASLTSTISATVDWDRL